MWPSVPWKASTRSPAAPMATPGGLSLVARHVPDAHTIAAADQAPPDGRDEVYRLVSVPVKLTHAVPSGATAAVGASFEVPPPTAIALPPPAGLMVPS